MSVNPNTPVAWRKKPVVIEAMRWDGTSKGADSIIAWILSGEGSATYQCSDPERCSALNGDTPHTIAIDTLEGTMQAGLGWYIIRGIQGEFYPCKPDIFEATYERPDQPTEPARCAPSREEVRAAFWGAAPAGYERWDDRFAAVQALYASQRTEAEVKAEAIAEAIVDLNEAHDEFVQFFPEATDQANGIARAGDWLVRHHKRLSAVQPTSVFEAMGLPSVEIPTRSMIPGSQERHSGPECSCGKAWSWTAGMCVAEVPNVGGGDRDRITGEIGTAGFPPRRGGKVG